MKKRILMCLLALLILGGTALTPGCRSIAAPAEGTDPSFAFLAGKHVAAQTGTISGEVALSVMPDLQIDYYNSQTDCLAALRAGKAAAWVSEEPVIRFMMIGNHDLTIQGGRLDGTSFAAVFARSDAGQALCDQYSAFVDKLWVNGTMAEIDAAWFGTDDSRRTLPDYTAFPDTNGTLRMAVDVFMPPFAYVKDYSIVGYDVDIAARFCEANGYRLEVVPMDFSGILPAVQNGKCDFSSCAITATAERAESVLFSSPNYHSGTVLCVLKAEQAENGQTKTYPSIDEVDGMRFAVLTGSISEQIIGKRYPNAKLNYFETQTDSLAALMAGKVDLWASDEPVIRFLQIEKPELKILDGQLTESNLAAVFPKTEAGQALCDRYSAFVDRLWADGTMKEIDAVWFGADDSKRTVLDYEHLPASNGTLHMAADLAHPPFAFMKDGRAVGYEVDVAARFCREYGYRLVIESMNFGGMLPAVQSGKVDFAASSITVTKERAESVLFSKPDYYGSIVLAMWDKDAAATAAQKGSGSQTAAAARPEYAQFSDLSGKTVSMLTGAPFEELVRSKAPDVGAFSSYSSTPDILLALKSGKTDAFLINNAIAALAVNREPELALFPQNLQDGTFGLAFAKDDPRRDTWQAAFDAIPQEAVRAAWDKWTGADEAVKKLPVQDWPGANGTVRAAVCDTLEPMSYMGGDGELKGFDLEVILMIAREMDVHVEFTGMEFSAVLASVQSGKADIGAGSIIITEERAQAVDFVEYYPAAFMLIVRAEKIPAAENVKNESSRSGIEESFDKTFVREGRWKLFLDGVLTTLLITLLAILFGTIFGFGIFMLCRNGNPAANFITRFCMWLVQGMPMVVLLMILYYIIFGSVAISGVFVAVIGFTLTFGAAVFGLLKMGVGAVDRGQYEAAYALGYSSRRTFFEIILPQALPHVLPAYRGEIVSLIKATAVVGYIAVQDLTKMGDIVRSRTYEAFFPLIAVTVIYFLLEALIGFLVSRISLGFDPERRSRERILKGVKTDD